jgi:hypothetical protein
MALQVGTDLPLVTVCGPNAADASATTTTSGDPTLPRMPAPPPQVSLRSVEVDVPDAPSTFQTVPRYLLGLVTAPLARAIGRPRPKMAALSGVNATFKAG